MHPAAGRRPRAGRLGAFLVTVVALAGACSDQSMPQWVDDGVHAVDGYWVLSEQPCVAVSSHQCTTFAAIAETALGIDPRLVVGVALAGLPQLWERSNGQIAITLPRSSGTLVAVVLDLADGTRRVTGVGCLGVPNADGSTTCLASPLDTYRVGHPPVD